MPFSASVCTNVNRLHSRRQSFPYCVNYVLIYDHRSSELRNSLTDRRTKMATPTKRTAVCRDTDRETEITRHLNALQDIKMGTIAAGDVLKEVLCEYFVNK